MHEENRLVKQERQTIVTIKDSILIDNGLLNKFRVKAIETTNYLQNRLPIRSWNYGEVISEKVWIGK